MFGRTSDNSLVPSRPGGGLNPHVRARTFKDFNINNKMKCNHTRKRSPVKPDQNGGDVFKDKCPHFGTVSMRDTQLTPVQTTFQSSKQVEPGILHTKCTLLTKKLSPLRLD